MELTTRNQNNPFAPMSRDQHSLVYFALKAQIFSAFWLLETGRYLLKNPYEVYWHYDEQLSDDQLEKIAEGGYEGEAEVEDDVYDNSIDYIYEQQCNQVEEQAKKAQRKDYLAAFLDAAEEDFEIDDTDEIFDTYKDEIMEELMTGRGMDIGLLRDYCSYDLDMKTLYRLTPNRTLALEIDLNDWFDDNERGTLDFDGLLSFRLGNIDIKEMVEIAEKIKQGNLLAKIPLKTLPESIWLDGVDVNGIDAVLNIPVANLSFSWERYDSHYDRDAQDFELVKESDVPVTVFGDETQSMFIDCFFTAKAPLLSNVDFDSPKPYLLAEHRTTWDMLIIVGYDPEEKKLFGWKDGAWGLFEMKPIEWACYGSFKYGKDLESAYCDLNGNVHWEQEAQEQLAA